MEPPAKVQRSAQAGRGPQPMTNSPTHPAETESVLREFLKNRLKEWAGWAELISAGCRYALPCPSERPGA